MSGLHSIRFEGREYLENGTFFLQSVTLSNSQGKSFPGDLPFGNSLNRLTRKVSSVAPWGLVKVSYEALANRLLITIALTNSSKDTIEQFSMELLKLRFPSSLNEYDGVTPLIENSVGHPAVVEVTHKGGRLGVVSEDRNKGIQLGLPWAIDRPQSRVFPLVLSTGKVDSLPDSYPKIIRPILPGHTETFVVSLRFASQSSAPLDVVKDAYTEFAADHPALLKWTDRRPIGALFLSTASAGWTRNPRGWLQDSNIDTTTPEGVGVLKRRVLDYAAGSIRILKGMNAQGMITWDIEGQQQPHPTSYIGDPRQFETLAPEMREIADEYFKSFRDQGLRVGVCIRPQELAIVGDKVSQETIVDPTSLLETKIRWANQRWGATLFYLDSNVTAEHSQTLSAKIVKSLASTFPDILLIPEHSNLEYQAYSAPYRELRQNYASSPRYTRLAYKNAFSVIYVADGPLEKRRQDFLYGVREGDVPLFRAWFEDPQNLLVKKVEAEAHPSR